MFGALYAADGSSADTLVAVAREFSPRVEVCSPREITLDLSGLTRLFGDAATIGQELDHTAADRGLRVRVAIAGTHTAARLLAAACRRPPTAVIVVDPGAEAASLAPLPIDLLAVVADAEPAPSHPRTLALSAAPSHPRTLAPSHRDFVSFRRWGLRTLGDLASVPADALAARLGQGGVRWQRLARGEDLRPLRPALSEERFEQALDLDWPIDGLEPLSFVLGRLMEPLSAHLERRGRGAAVLHVRLHLVTRVVHERVLQLPAPMRDARTLCTLALLDLESHSPSAAIDRVVVAVDPTPGRVVQCSLLTRPLPPPEQLSTLMARLSALMGEGRGGSPVEVDSWRPGACAMKIFAPSDPNAIHSRGLRRYGGTETRLSDRDDLRVSVSPWPVAINVAANQPVVALRRFRFPVPARVRVEQGRPCRVVTDRRGLTGGRVQICAGPWRTSGGWWGEGGPPHPPSWDRDEWDVALSDGAAYRLFRERAADAWFIEGVVD